jgi:hypothetical protein
MTRIDKSLEAVPYVQRAVARGYEISYDHDPDNRRRLDFSVRHGGKPAAHATFSVMKSQKVAQEESVYVYDEHQAHDVGTAIYVCAKLVTGYKLLRCGNQTEQEKALWNQPNRPWQSRADIFGGAGST